MSKFLRDNNGKIIINGETRTPYVVTDEVFDRVTYGDLKMLRDNGALVAGKQYRITDYVCTTTQENTQSAGHAFDIIVTADSANTLNENARAVAHEGDTYFTDCHLGAWEIKYCLDNDKTRFWWASVARFWITTDVASRKVYILDEKAVFDGQEYFKTTRTRLFASVAEPKTVQEMYYFNGSELVTFEEDGDSLDDWGKEAEGTGVIYYMKDEYNNECPYDFKSIQFKRWQTDDEATNDDKFYSSWDDTGNDFRWCYTFMANGTSNDTWADASTIKPYGYMSDEGKMPCVNNTIKPFIQMYEGSEEAKDGSQWLNNIVLYGSYEDNPTISDNYEYNYIQCPCGNKFGINNRSITIGSDYSSNNNTFGDYCERNIFGNNCNGNTFGNTCNGNTFGGNCNGNTFGNTCNGNTFGGNCCDNTFGNYCFRNTLGGNCYGNTFGHNCERNIFGNNCNNNTIDSIVRGANPQPTSGSFAMQGIHIHYGVTGTFTVTRGANYQQDVRTADDVTITV